MWFVVKYMYPGRRTERANQQEYSNDDNDTQHICWLVLKDPIAHIPLAEIELFTLLSFLTSEKILQFLITKGRLQLFGDCLLVAGAKRDAAGRFGHITI